MPSPNRPRPPRHLSTSHLLFLYHKFAPGLVQSSPDTLNHFVVVAEQCVSLRAANTSNMAESHRRLICQCGLREPEPSENTGWL